MCFYVRHTIEISVHDARVHRNGLENNSNWQGSECELLTCEIKLFGLGLSEIGYLTQCVVDGIVPVARHSLIMYFVQINSFHRIQIAYISVASNSTLCHQQTQNFQCFLIRNSSAEVLRLLEWILSLCSMLNICESIVIRYFFCQSQRKFGLLSQMGLPKIETFQFWLWFSDWVFVYKASEWSHANTGFMSIFD